MHTSPTRVTLDANEAVASVAYRLSEAIAIYPITPSSPMAEHADEWVAKNKPNLWGGIPAITQMQSEAGVAGTLHGFLQGGAAATTFTASQGLLLMIPVLYKIAGELLPFCFHVTARALATHALSIFGDHSDVMACRQTGVAMLCSSSVQEAHDFALIGHCATFASRIPFLHFFDGFRTSHEISKIEWLDDSVLKALFPYAKLREHQAHRLNPDRPVLRGSAQNPDVFFQAREAANPYYDATPAIVRHYFQQFAQLTGREYHLFDYTGAPDAEEVAIVLGSAAETLDEASAWLNDRGAQTGVLRVRLFRPFDGAALLAALPKSVRSISVLDRTKEPGSLGEPLYQDVMTAVAEAAMEGDWDAHLPRVVGGRYGLGSKEFTPAMARAVFEDLRKESPKRRFSIGIEDDVTHQSLAYDKKFVLEPPGSFRAVFYGLGSDGTVGANKNSIKIIGEETDNYVQGYFVYDSKKSGAITISHLRFGPEPIHAPFLIQSAQFIGCHQPQFVERLDLLEFAAPGAVFLLNTPLEPEKVFDSLPLELQEGMIEKQVKLYVINADAVARSAKMGGRINTIMQTCFFAISGVLPRDEAIAHVKEAARKTYAKKGADVVERNWRAIDETLAGLHLVHLPETATARRHRAPAVCAAAPAFVQEVTATMIANRGDDLPVSAFPPDGTWPTGTAQWEKRNLAREIPAWDPSICIQCNKCVLVCPHAAIRAKFYPEEQCAGAPEGFLSAPFRSREYAGHRYTIQVAPEDCTGCTLCVDVCPAKSKVAPDHKALGLVSHVEVVDQQRAAFDFFEKLPDPPRSTGERDVKTSQFNRPLFEFSGACAGCGETPYVKLLTQLFGDRLVVANATGCSSIYGGNLPTTPYCTNHLGQGPAWCNSLFEDNAEFGLGLRIAADQHRQEAVRLVEALSPVIGSRWLDAYRQAQGKSEAAVEQQRALVRDLLTTLDSVPGETASRLRDYSSFLVHKSVWIVGGDGWAYDIGFGGLDHVLSQMYDINILVLDTEVYSNTGGQQSKSTPIGAVAKFAAAGKAVGKKDLALHAINYGHAYVARVAFGAKDGQTVKAFEEAELYDGPAIIIAYSHCIAHGYAIEHGLDQQRLAVQSGSWPLLRYDPRRSDRGEEPLVIDSGKITATVAEYRSKETRFKMLERLNPEAAKTYTEAAQVEAERQLARYRHLFSNGKHE